MVIIAATRFGSEAIDRHHLEVELEALQQALDRIGNSLTDTAMERRHRKALQGRQQQLKAQLVAEYDQWQLGYRKGEQNQ